MGSSTTAASPCLRTGTLDESQRAHREEIHLARCLPQFTTAACIAFGIVLIANTQLANDGGWFWYAVLHRAGKHLYSDMHVVFQPLAVLETEWWMALAGHGWLASKVPAILHLVAFVLGIALIAEQTKWTHLQKAIVLACAFFVGIHFEAYRFDDYHVMVHVCFLFAILLLLKLEGKEGAACLQIASALGVLSGLAMATRLNDGAALFAGTLLCIAGSARLKTMAVATAALACAASLFMAVLFTGDSVRDYALNAVLHAAGPKGGIVHVLRTPLLLFWNSAAYLKDDQVLLVILLAAMVAVSWVFLLRPFSRQDLPNSTIKAVIGAALGGGSLLRLYPALGNGDFIVVLSAMCVLAAYAVTMVVLARMAIRMFRRGRSGPGNWREMILLLPFGLLLAGATSSGGYHFGLYTPVAFFLLVLPVVFPAVFQRKWLRESFVAIAFLMAISGAWFKVVHPASWNNYGTFPMFRNRLVIRHPAYGPMIVDRNLYQFFGSICSVIRQDANPQLLSIPFPYANYYCDTPPWQGFVQTFFDTSGKEVLDDMIAKLEQSPPRWVLYQRQLDVLALHEAAFNDGKRLPHRDLDDYIIGKITSGRWHLVWRGRYGKGSDWLLSRTD